MDKQLLKILLSPALLVLNVWLHYIMTPSPNFKNVVVVVSLYSNPGQQHSSYYRSEYTQGIVVKLGLLSLGRECKDHCAHSFVKNPFCKSPCTIASGFFLLHGWFLPSRSPSWPYCNFE